MIIVKNKRAIEKMTEAGRLLATIFNELSSESLLGKTTAEIDSWIAKRLKHYGLVSMTQGYCGYKHVSCISINDEVVHGVPSDKKMIKNGDIVKIDVCASWSGYCADMARCFVVGKISASVIDFLAGCQEALDAGIEKAVVGSRLSNISVAIQRVSRGFA